MHTLLSKSFREAAGDYRHLLEKGYPEKSVHKLVGDRYALSGTQRTMLYRGIATPGEARKRREKLLAGPIPEKARLFIDALNVMLTIGSYLNGNTVYLSADGLLRDASEIHGKAFRRDLLERSARILASHIKKLPGPSLVFVIDAPSTQSTYVRNILENTFMGMQQETDVLLVPSADAYLKKMRDGILCTSDSRLIDATILPVLDLARACLEYHYETDWLDLDTLFPE